MSIDIESKLCNKCGHNVAVNLEGNESCGCHEPKLDKVRMPDSNKYSPAEEDTKHTALKIKKELFEKDPDNFIHVDEIVIAALRSEHGIGVMIGKCSRQDMELALTRISYRGFSLFQQMEIQQAMKREKEGIITAPGGKPAGGIIT